MKEFKNIEQVINKINKLGYKSFLGFRKIVIIKEDQELTPTVTVIYNQENNSLLEIDYSLPKIEITNRNKYKVLLLIKEADKMLSKIQKIWV